MFGMCVACGDLLESAGVVGTLMLECRHQYHPICFSALLLSRDHCDKPGCNMVIPKVAKSWVGGHRVVKSKLVCVLQIICLPPLNVRLFVSMLSIYIFAEEDDAATARPGGRNGQAAKAGPDATKFAASQVWEEGEDTKQIREVMQDLEHGSFEGKGTEKG